MLKRTLGRIGSAHVIALAALVVALSSGAFAVDGPGKLLVGSATPDDQFSTIMDLADFGKVQVRCDTGDSAVEVRLKNTTGSTTFMRTFQQDTGDYDSEVIQAGDNGDTHGSDLVETLELHVFKGAGAKQAQATVSTAAAGGICTTAKIIALNSAA